MRRLLLLALFCALLPTSAHAATRCTGGTRDTRSTVFEVGDSVSVYTKDDLPARYEVNARSSRTVDCLPSIIRSRLKHGTPKVAILALGTNPVVHWTLADYRRSVDAFPTSTRVVLVTPYRDPRRHPTASKFIDRYATNMRALAKRSNVYLADWATYIRKHRSQLRDGTHPTAAGQRAWARLVVSAVNR